MLRAVLLLLAAGLPGLAAADPPWDGQKVAFFGVTFLDTSAEGELAGPRDDEAARVALVGDRIDAAFTEHGATLLDLAPVADDLARTVNPSNCYGCDQRMAAKLGADLIVVSEVQKVSNLILTMNIEVRDPTTGALLRGRAVDIRGNTDESWQRGVDYLLKHGIFRD